MLFRSLVPISLIRLILLHANACLALSLARSISCFLSPLLAPIAPVPREVIVPIEPSRSAGLEQWLSGFDGVTHATVSFMTQKLTLEADSARFDQIVKEAVKACKKVEPDCEIVVK